MTKLKVIKKDEVIKIKLNLKINYCNNLLKKIKGYMFKTKKDEILIFPFNREQIISIHSFFVKYNLYCIWLKKDTVVETTVIKPFNIYRPTSKADKLIEIPYEEYNKIKKNIKLMKGKKLIIEE
ncbi:MAG: hypothetical protein ACOCRO_00295 [Halanaerobiales bacterium]